MYYNVVCIAFLFIVLPLYQVIAQDSTLTKLRRKNLSIEHYNKGVQYFNKQSYDLAINEFETAISLNALDHMTYYFNGLSYEQKDNLEKALFNYSLSLSISPEFTEALFNRSKVLFKLGKYEEAIKDLKQLLILPPGETQAVYFRGIKYGVNDKESGFNQVISMTNKEADVYNYLGLCYYYLELHEESRSNFAEAIIRNPYDDNVQTNAGLNFLAMGLPDSALAHFQSALRINPHNTVAQLNLTLCQPESAPDQINKLNELIDKNKDFPMAYAQRAYQYYLKGDYSEAISDYSSAIKLDTENSDYYLERGMLYLKTDMLDHAIRDFKSALNLDNNHYKIWYNLANAYFLKEEYQTSLEYYSQAIHLNPNMSELYYNRSLSYFYLNDIERACEDMAISQSLGNTNAVQFLQKNCQ
jgi:tetratricopeptide (TPR) repeat protein